jgi:hypothetical protein
MPDGFRRVVAMPLDCELVFSAERPVNRLPTMSVAFGRKGRSEMKLFEVPMVLTSLAGLCFSFAADIVPARAAFTFGEPVDHDAAMWFFPNNGIAVGCLSSDDLEMFVGSDLAGGQGSIDIWVLRRASPEEDWGPPENLGPTVNSAGFEVAGSISPDGLELYFISSRPGGYGGNDMYVARRTTRTSPWGLPSSLGPKVNTPYAEAGLSVSSDGLELYFASGRGGPGRVGGIDLYVSTRATTQDLWGDPENLGPAVNSPSWEQVPSLSPDGRLLFFISDRPGGYGDYDIWMTRRASHTAAWEPAVNLGPTINSPDVDLGGCLAPDGSTLYFARGWPDSANQPCKAPIIPILDFNGDAKVDALDMALSEANWQQADPVGDVGPFPWGDGMVDEKDLKVLMGGLMTPGPKASEVPCDVVLSWISPSFADSHDVYLGTSSDQVNNATREDPSGVLVSEGQMETTCNPEGLLEFSQTYYWRVDEIEVVVGSLRPAIFRGPVVSFTTEAYAYPIRNIIATASGSQPDMGPQNTINSSGLDQNDAHSTVGADMWQSAATPGPHWIQFGFDKIHTLHELWVWNSNQVIEPIVGFGAKTARIEYSTDGTAWIALADVPQFARASGRPGYVADTKISFGGVQARYVKLTIEANWGGVSPSTGLSEVRFFYIPEKSTVQP